MSIDPDLVRHDGGEDRADSLSDRFRRATSGSTWSTPRLSDPSFVSVLDADEDRGVHFLTMEYIGWRGVSLEPVRRWASSTARPPSSLSRLRDPGRSGA